MSKLLNRIGLAVLSGVLTAVSYPDFSLGLLVFVAPVPLVLAVAWAARDREALLLGWIAVSITWLINVPWVIPVMSKFGGLPYPVGVAIYIAMAMWLGVFGAIFGWLVYRLAPRGAGLFVWLSIPPAFIAVEYARTWLFSGFPWHLASEALIDTPELAMPARWIGPYGVGFMVLVIAVLVARSTEGFIDGRSAAPWLVAAAIVSGAWFGIGRAMLVSARLSLEDETKIVVGIVQPNIEQEVRWDSAKTFEIFDGLVEQTDEVIDKGAAVVLWPESTIASAYENARFWRDWIEGLTRRTGVDVILGSVAHSGGDRYTNSALLIRDGAIAGRYDKIRLVPFGEYVPMKKALFFAEKLVRAVGDFEFGTNPDPLDGRVPYGMAICYEVVYPSIPAETVRRGAELLVTITNDAWFDVSAAPYQHLAMARMRAIENDRWMIRSGTTGISAIIDPTGEVIAQVPLGERGVLVGDVGIRTTLTPYTRGGDWAAWMCVVMTIVATGWRMRSRTPEVQAD